MNPIKKSIVLIIFLLFSINCVVGQTSGNFPIGKINSKVTYLKDESRSYAIYFPFQVVENQECPLIYIYAPESKGSKTLNYFIDAADKNGYVLVSSNEDVTRNLNLAMEVTEMMIEDLNLRFNFKGEKIYAAGLLTGGEIASKIANITEVFSGVLDYSKEISLKPIFKPQFRKEFSYVKIAEPTIKNSNRINYLNAIGIPSQLIYNESEISEPSSKQILKAFEWLEKQNDSPSKFNPLDKLF